MTSATTDAKDLNGRYGLNPPHSEIVQACQIIKPGEALDMGCSSGRNALYLSRLGFNVTAVDANPSGIGMVQSIVEQEGITNIQARVYDINDAALDATYDFIACTVTLMFLDPDRIPAVLDDMQNNTRPGGYNLIVCAMNSDEYPCPVNFPFTFAPGELSTIYDGWELVKYNEDLGTMHSGAQLQFATMLARKNG